MDNAVALCCALLAQQLEVAPAVAGVGQQVEIRVTDGRSGVGSIEVRAGLPGGSDELVGTTDAAGILPFVPKVAGDHLFAARVGGVRVLTPLRVVAERDTWFLAIGCVPLALAGAWALSRARGRRAP